MFQPHPILATPRQFEHEFCFDGAIVRRAVEDGYVLVTNNMTDFTMLVEREDVHAALICLNGAPGLMSLNVQKRLFEHALNQLDGEEPVNEVLEITLTEERIVRVDRYVVPDPD